MTRIWFCVILALAAADTLATEPPNILLLVADDLGWADVSFHGGGIQTPRLDRLVTEGATFSRFYVCPICSPTRAGLMTGRYPIRFGLMRAVLPPWRQGGLDPAEVTLPQVLARAGYQGRGIFGKWHLGHSDIQYHPLHRGFTEFMGHYNGAIDYFTHEREGELDWHRDYASNHDQGYSTDLIADAAVSFINRHARSTSPWFCYVPFNAPHSPLQAKQADLDRYDHLAGDKPRLGPPGKRTDGFGATGRGRSQRQTLAAMIACLDQGIGRILDALEANHIADNTLVWFFSDNGGITPGDNRPLNGQKATVYEGGIRVAAAARWPGRIAAASRIDVPVAYIDVLPTLMHVAGVPSHGGKPLDGIDALDILTGKTTEYPRDLYSYIGQAGEDREQITLIEPQWKLIVIGPRINDASIPRSQRQVLLFSIVDDPYEQTNLTDAHPEIVARMWDKLVTFRTLQPPDGVPSYGDRDPAFRPPPEWKIPE